MFPRYKLVRQKGSMLVIAIFVIVVMSLLGLAMSRILSASANTIVYEVYGLRALQAARAGLELSIANVFPVPAPVPPDGGTCTAVLDSDAAFPAFSSVPGFENCSFLAECSATTFGSGATGGTLYRFSSTGRCEVGDISVSRTVSVEAKE